MTFTDYCLREAALYGKKGNKTLECISVTCEKSAASEMKTYFDGLVEKGGTGDLHNGMEDCAAIPDEILSGMKNVTRNFPGVKVADTVIYRPSGGKSAEYAVNLLTAGISYEQAIEIPKALSELYETGVDLAGNLLRDMETVAECLPVYQNGNGNRLNNIGLRFNENVIVIAAKYYLNIQKVFSHDNGFDADIVRTVSGYGNTGALAIPEKYGYFPTLLGVNVRKDRTKEMKVYFDTGKRAGKHADIVEKSSEMIDELGACGLFPDEGLQKLYDRGIFLRGVGINPAVPGKIRFYMVERN